MDGAVEVLGSSLREARSLANKPALRVYVLLVPGLLVLNIWPALYNHQPFFYADTSAYIRGADAGIQRLTGRQSAWSPDERSSSVSLNSIRDKAVLSGRSVYYGALLYLGDLTGRLWPVVFVQSAAVLLALALTLRALNLFTAGCLAIISLVLATVTPLPFFVSFLMPDIFAGIAILATVNLLLFRQDSRWTTLVWAALLSGALLFHVSHPLLTIVLMIVVLLSAAAFRVQLWKSGIITVLCAVLIAFSGEFLFNTAVKKLIGEPPLRPPMLMARMIADGPGYRYLRANCPGADFTVCRFLDRLPVSNDDFLWDRNPVRGVFAVTNPKTRRALSNEQYRFAWAVFRFDPLGELDAFFRNTAAQFTRIGYQEFQYDSGTNEFFRTHLPARYYNALTRTAASRGSLPIAIFSALTVIATCAAAGCICFLLFARLARKRLAVAFALFVCAGIIVNAAVCALSAPHDRYEARVIWLVPFAAMLLLFKSSGAPRSKT